METFAEVSICTQTGIKRKGADLVSPINFGHQVRPGVGEPAEVQEFLIPAFLFLPPPLLG